MQLSWLGILRLGLVQTALGAIVVLTTSTINRLMIVELELAAIVPGMLVTWHYALQALRPRWGHGSDGRRRTPWIIAGMATLAVGGIAAAASIAVMESSRPAGIALAAVAFTIIGIGVGAAGTSLLALLAQLVAAERRAAAATMVWIMMISGFIVTAATVGSLLDPFTPARLLAIATGICTVAFVVTCIAILGVEPRASGTTTESEAPKPSVPFRQALGDVWQDGDARRFALFVFVSMLAYSMQDLILEPFAGVVFAYTPGQSTALSGIQNSGVLVGMLLVGVLATLRAKSTGTSLRGWTVGGCAASAAALLGLVYAAGADAGPALRPLVFGLGFANGVFAVAAIGSMFNLASADKERRQGVRMGLFGASQAIAFGLGGFVGTVLVDVTRGLGSPPAAAYATTFAIEACLFLAAAMMALRVGGEAGRGSAVNPLVMAARHQVGT